MSLFHTIIPPAPLMMHLYFVLQMQMKFQRGVPLDFLQAMAEAEAEGQSIKLSAFMPDGSSVSHELNSKAKSKDSKKFSHPKEPTASQSAKSSAMHPKQGSQGSVKSANQKKVAKQKQSVQDEDEEVSEWFKMSGGRVVTPKDLGITPEMLGASAGSKNKEKETPPQLGNQHDRSGSAGVDYKKILKESYPGMSERKPSSEIWYTKDNVVCSISIS